jgi:hypothetical protein
MLTTFVGAIVSVTVLVLCGLVARSLSSEP